MVTGTPISIGSDGVRSLQDAHEQVAREWPGRYAPATVMRGYYEWAARVYQQVADTDPDHQHEARFWAQQERETAQGYAARIAARESAKRGTGAGLEVEGRPAPASSSSIPLTAKEQRP